MNTEESPAIDVETQAVALRPQSLSPADATKAPVTAAQAKVDAIASLTMSAYAKAATLVITPEEAAKLAMDFPDEAFKPGAGGKENLIYIEHAYLRDRMSQVFGMGRWAIIPRNRWAEEFTTGKGTAGSRVYVEAMLVIRGCFVSEAVGAMEYYPKNESQNYGDAVEGAKTAAFRRCAKELGVGLQAWKKDWCDAWWQRRRGGRGTPAPPGPSTPPSRHTPPAQSAAKAPAASAPAPKPAAAPRYPTPATRDWMIDQLKDCIDLATEYFRKLANPAVLMANEHLQDVPLEFVPITRDQLRFLKAAITDFGNGEEVKHAYPMNPLAPVAEKPKEAPKAKAAPAAAPAPTRPPPKDDEAWRDIIVPIPNKDQKRADYIGNPDTIGSLYDRCKAGEQAACKRLYGFVGHYEPKPWTGRDGALHPPSDTDTTFRAALDQFKDWHDRNGGDTDPPAPLPGDPKNRVLEKHHGNPDPDPGEEYQDEVLF